MARKLSTAKVTALTCIRDHGHYGPARSNTVTALENDKMFYDVPSTTGGFPTLFLTKAGAAALAGALDTVATPAPVRPLYMRRADAISMFEILGYGVAENGVWMRSVGAHISTRFFTYTADLVEGNWIACDDEGDPQQRPTNPLADKTPVEIDTRAAELDGRYGQVDGLRAAIVDRLQYRAGQRPTKTTRSGRKPWTLSADDAAAELRRRLDAGEVDSWDVQTARELLSRLAEVDAELVANRAEAAAIEAEYDRRPWSRFVGVEGGHIHSGIWCAGGTIRPTTTRTWAPALSGLSVADAVAKLGPTLCTHCFPSAPVEWTQGAAKVDDSCPGSGQAEVPGTYVSRAAPIGKCRGCEKFQSMTPRGYIRKHKPAPCSGSGKGVVAGSFWRGVGECGECHTSQSVTSRGTIGSHQPPK